MQTDGINSLEYKVLQKIHRKLYVHVTVTLEESGMYFHRHAAPKTETPGRVNVRLVRPFSVWGIILKCDQTSFKSYFYTKDICQ